MKNTVKAIAERIRGDRMIWYIVIFLSLFSLLAVYSSTGTLAYRYKSGNTEYYLFKHLSLLVFSLTLMFFAHLADYRLYSRLSQVLLIISFPLLVITLLFGADINDASRWITLPVLNISFQTSDLAKLALIMYVARYLSRNQEKLSSFRNGFLPIIGIVAGICLLIAPANLSSSMVLFFTCLLILFIGGVKLKFIGGTILSGIAVLGLIIALSYAFPHVGRFGTWQNRIESFISPEEESYQVTHSKIAIAEGGIIGKGPGNSTQRNFLPHPYSDFIFSIIIEEYGLVGGVILIFLYLWFLFRSIRIVIRAPGTFGAFLAAGLSFSLIIQALVNMAVAVHLFPVTGLTLPLVSMGGTSLWFTGISIGIILSVSRYIELENEREKEKPSTENVPAAA